MGASLTPRKNNADCGRFRVDKAHSINYIWKGKIALIATPDILAGFDPPGGVA